MFLFLFTLAFSDDAPVAPPPPFPDDRESQLVWLIAYDPAGFADQVDIRKSASRWTAISQETAETISTICRMRYVNPETTIQICQEVSACLVYGLRVEEFAAICGSCKAVYPYTTLMGCEKHFSPPSPAPFQFK